MLTGLVSRTGLGEQRMDEVLEDLFNVAEKRSENVHLMCERSVIDLIVDVTV